MSVTIDPRLYDAVIFDLDGVVTDTAVIHAAAWKRTFDQFLSGRRTCAGQNHTGFTEEDYLHFVDGKPRQQGVTDFLESRGITLPNGGGDGEGDTVAGLCSAKQRNFVELLEHKPVPAFESTVVLVRKLTEIGVATAVFTSSRNCDRILDAAGLGDLFSVRVDGVVAETLGLPGKPDPAALLEAARRLGADPQRTVVVEDAEAGVQAGSDGGFALVIGVDRTAVDRTAVDRTAVDRTAVDSERLRHSGADVVVSDLADVVVRTGYTRMSFLPNALEAGGQVLGVIGGRKPFVCLDFDGTLSEIVADPDDARLIEGVATALADLAARYPVAILSGRDLADIRDRVGLPGLWYAGSHGFELVGPDGTHHHHDAAASAVPVLRAAAESLRDELAHVPGVRIEHKRYALAVHYRNTDPDRIGEVRAATRRCGLSNNLRVTGGRKVFELRPNIAWDKGAALDWIRGRIQIFGRALPIYIGDDSTDEDAFDAVRFDGIGIAVRSGEDGDRPTAAQFTLSGPDEVSTFLRQVAGWLSSEQQASDEAWTFTFEGYDPHSEKLREAMCTVGNGYFATRGAAPEAKADQVHYPGTYAAGLYNRLDDIVDGRNTSHESLVNLPNWLPLTFRIDAGDWFDIDTVTLLSYRQTLDLRGAVLTRRLRFRDGAGRTTSVAQHRFAAMHMPHIGALETTISAEDWSGTIEIRSTIDGNARNCGVERYRDLASQHFRSLKKVALSENSVMVSVTTTQSHIAVAVAARTTVWRDGIAASADYRLVEEEFEIGHQIVTDLTVGRSVTVEKVVSLVTGRDVATSEVAVAAERRLARQGRLGEIRDAHILRWSHLWERMNIEFEDHTGELRILRLHLLHLLQTVSYNSDDLDVGVPARGLHGEAYRGHIFWDELFIFPVLNLRFPMITRSLLRYRYRRLLEARRAAKLAGYAGAMFPWQSGSDGREESPELHLNPRSGRWNPDPSNRAHHIGIAVAYNVWQFYQTTGDLAYMIDYGTEMLVEIARFWVSRTTYDQPDDRYDINGVIGPDEFHSGYPDRPYGGVDNNAYTNVMAVWVILRAVEALEMMPLANRLDLLEQLGLTTAEIEHWDHISRRMRVPFHDGVISQFEGYETLAELDWEAYRERYGNIQRLDRILEAEDDDVNGYKASKQADVLMLLFLLSSDELRELLDRLGYRFRPEQIPRMVDYYLARTSHGSTLSAVVHTWVLARANRERAMKFFQQVLRSDVADIQGGTTSEGIHLAAMAGSVDLVQRCFTGLETRGGRIILSPHWPETLGALDVPIHYRGYRMRLRVSGKGAEVSIDSRETSPVLIECRGNVQRLAPGCTIRFPYGANRSPGGNS